MLSGKSTVFTVRTDCHNMNEYRFSRQAAILGKSVFDHVPGTISLSSASAYPPLLPNVVKEAIEAVGPFREEAMQYAPLMGLDELRHEICNFVLEDGVKCGIDNVLITYGAKSAFDLALRAFVEPGDKVIVSRPTYMTAIHIMRTHNVQFVEVERDENGFSTDNLESKLQRMRHNAEPMPKLLFDVPDFHNPTGVTTTLSRREKMLELAEHYNFVICEDDPYRRIRFEGEAIPPIKSLDESAHVLALGTVSKILAPGLRVGWALGDYAIVRRMAMQKSDGGSNAFAQRIVVQMLQSRKVDQHINELIHQMRIHRDAMIDALSKHIPEATVQSPQGGYFLWVELPRGANGDRLTELGIEEGVEISPGRLSFANDGPDNFIRLAYSFTPETQIREGIKKLGRAWQKMNS